MPSGLDLHIQDFDGKNITVLAEARVACGSAPGYLEELVALCADPRASVADGATWILKAELEDGLALPQEMTARLVASLDGVQSWQARLHLCQSVEALDLSADQAETVIRWAQALSNHDRPFLRAWSLHVIVTLARRFDSHRAEAEAALAAAEADPAASVRARARRLH